MKAISAAAMPSTTDKEQSVPLKKAIADANAVEVGTKVFHHIRGDGVVIEIDEHDERGARVYTHVRAHAATHSATHSAMHRQAVRHQVRE